MRCQAFAIYEHLSDCAVSKKRESQNTEGCDDLTDNADDCVRGVIADDPAGDADTDRNGNENDQCEICGPKLFPSSPTFYHISPKNQATA